MYLSLKHSILLNVKNIPGHHTARKIVVIECDDWGGIRMPSISTHNQLLNANIPVNSNIFDRFDTLEDKQDLEFLFEILLNVKDKNGHHAVMTTVTNVANPDFEKIKNRTSQNISTNHLPKH